MHIIADLGGRLISLAGSVFISILPDFAKFDADMAEHLKPAVNAVDIKVDDQSLKDAQGRVSAFAKPAVKGVGVKVDDQSLKDAQGKVGAFDKPSVKAVAVKVDDQSLKDATGKVSAFDKPSVKAIGVKVDEQGLKSATGAFRGFGAVVDGAMLKAKTPAAKVGDSWIAAGTSM